MIALIASFAISTADMRPSGYAEQDFPVRFKHKIVLNKPQKFTKKVIALTFDDGPSSTITPLVLDELKAANAKATFFVLGNMARQHPELVKRAVDEGHVVGSHTWDHAARPSAERAIGEIDNTAHQIYLATGQWPVLFRPPYGIQNGNTDKRARSQGYASILWNRLGPDTVKAPSAEAIAAQVIREASPGDIVLFHDTYGKMPTAKALPQILAALKQKGLETVTVPEMLKAWDQQIVALETAKKKPIKVAKKDMKVDAKQPKTL